jgi:hypothetical protein
MSERANAIQDPQNCEVGGVAIIYLTKLGNRSRRKVEKFKNPSTFGYMFKPIV